MKAYLVERPARDWCQDYAMVIIAQDERHAERKARVSSDDFKKCQEITITEIDMNEEQCVLTANTGAQEDSNMRSENIEVTFKIPILVDKPDLNGVIYSKEAIRNAYKNVKDILEPSDLTDHQVKTEFIC